MTSHATRAPAWYVLHLLRREAERTGDSSYAVQAGTLRQWVHRGHIGRGRGGYDLAEVLHYLTTRKNGRNVGCGQLCPQSADVTPAS